MKTTLALTALTTLVLAGCGANSASHLNAAPKELKLDVTCSEVVGSLEPLGDTRLAARPITDHRVGLLIENYPTECSESFHAHSQFGPASLALRIAGEYTQRCLCSVAFAPIALTLPAGTDWQDFQEFQIHLIRTGDLYEQASWSVRDLQGF